MKTAYMGEGRVVVSTVSHKKISGRLVIFSKARHKLPILPLSERISTKEIGKSLFQIYFPNKESLKRLADCLQMIYEEWDNES